MKPECNVILEHVRTELEILTVVNATCDYPISTPDHPDLGDFGAALANDIGGPGFQQDVGLYWRLDLPQPDCNAIALALAIQLNVRVLLNLDGVEAFRLYDPTGAVRDVSLPAHADWPVLPDEA